MTKLREMAEQAARDALGHGGLLQVHLVTDAIERTAKEFAGRSLKHVMSAYQHPNMPTFIATAMIPKRNGLFGLGYSSLEQAQEHVDWAITEILSAAERGE